MHSSLLARIIGTLALAALVGRLVADTVWLWSGRPANTNAPSRCFAFCGSQLLARSRGKLLAREAWLEVSRTSQEEAAEGRVLPIFPAGSVLWPGSTVQFGVVQPGHQRLYEDLLESGARQVLAPFVHVPQPSSNTGQLGTGERPNTYLLSSTAAVLNLEELLETSAQSQGAVKYVAKHSVCGRANIEKILNPSAMFETNERQDPGPLEAPRHIAGKLASAWEELRTLSGQLEEPRFDQPFSLDSLSKTSTWKLAESWYKLRQQLQAHREQARISSAVNAWIEAEKEQGRLHTSPGQALKALPQQLLNVVVRLNGPTGPDFETDFYEPFLRLLVTEDSQSRSKLLLDMVCDEVQTTRTLLSIRECLD
eukprot:TRINITY_DN5178_c0_g2_i2.p1 TRINITY_DN5178_c0_g2~~TRINITY_DN5178_c0_g2_i2.p1  ORF type:complete len:379 (-),score=64.51 TRINITY_DN5178_c0_g2_i2:8-1108(-)